MKVITLLLNQLKNIFILFHRTDKLEGVSNKVNMTFPFFLDVLILSFITPLTYFPLQLINHKVFRSDYFLISSMAWKFVSLITSSKSIFVQVR